METIPLENCGPSLTVEVLVAFENELGGHLPDDYKQFLLDHNGGFCEPKLGLTWDGQLHIIPYFHPLLPVTEEAGGLRNNLRRLSDVNPSKVDGCLPIASTYGDTSICLAYKGPCTGAVFYTEFEYKVVFRGDLVPIDVAMVPLADSFTELLDKLVVIPNPYCRIEDLGKRGTADDLAKYLEEGQSIDALSKSGFSILCEAIKFENLPMIEACIERGASLSHSIHKAVGNHRVELIPRLVNAGADINERDEFGDTPLHDVGGTALPGAAGDRNRELKKLLISLGAHE